MSSRKIIDYLIIFFLFLFVNSFPITTIIKNRFIALLIYFLMNIFYLLFLYFFIKKRTLFSFYPRSANKKNILLLLPLLFVCGSNFLYLSFIPKDISNFPTWIILLDIPLTILTVLKEETLFRLILIPNLDKVKSRFLRILISSFFFSLVHLANYFVNLDPSFFIQMAYTFGLGLIFGFLYEYGRSWIAAMGFHFVFNIINSTLFESYVESVSNYYAFILINVCVTVLAGSYLTLIYFLILRKQPLLAE